MTRAFLTERLRWLFLAGAVALPTLATVWAFWTTLVEMAGRWNHDPQYSHGYLVPAFAGVLLWLRRKHCAGVWPSPTWWGLPILALGVALRLVGSFFYYVWVDQISLLVCLAGALVMVGGRPTVRWAWPSVLFLAFMVPLPFRVDTALAGPLQRLATVVSTFCLQTLGLPALAEGNTILLNDHEIGIVEACSGLRMLIVFFALSAGVALVVQRRFWEKAVIVASAIPIALACNVARITATGFLLEHVSSQSANLFFHDLAGWFMMPLGLTMLAVELMILTRLFLETTNAGPLTVGLEAAGLSAVVPRQRKPWKRAQTTEKVGGQLSVVRGQ
ncbi:MAG: exosortase/archaeosortase family protein [Gemmataceae bacterium]